MILRPNGRSSSGLNVSLSNAGMSQSTPSSKRHKGVRRRPDIHDFYDESYQLKASQYNPRTAGATAGVLRGS